MRNIPGKIAAINDLSGYGRCSLAVMLPVISVCGYQCCPVPTAVLSSSHEFKEPFLHELTDQMPSYIEHWENLGLHFDGIYSGYLSSIDQISSVLRFISSFKKEETTVMVDPIFADHGRMSPRCTKDWMCRYLQLIAKADIITPNLTEACFLVGKPYEEYPSEEFMDELGKELLSIGPKEVVITGLKTDSDSRTYIYTETEKHIVSAPYCPQDRTGTGDLFASILFSKYLDGVSLRDAAQQAADFVSSVMAFSYEQKVPKEQGICFEPFLGQLAPCKK